MTFKEYQKELNRCKNEIRDLNTLFITQVLCELFGFKNEYNLSLKEQAEIYHKINGSVKIADILKESNGLVWKYNKNGELYIRDIRMDEIDWDSLTGKVVEE